MYEKRIMHLLSDTRRRIPGFMLFPMRPYMMGFARSSSPCTMHTPRCTPHRTRGVVHTGTRGVGTTMQTFLHWCYTSLLLYTIITLFTQNPSTTLYIKLLII